MMRDLTGAARRRVVVVALEHPGDTTGLRVGVVLRT
jgi:hypothetical protein